MGRERAKSIILSLLVILSIMSVHKIWFDSPMPLLQTEATSNKEQQHKILDIRKQVLSPRKVILGFGGGTRNDYYTVLNYEETKVVWEQSKPLLLDFFTGDVDVELISYDKYIENNKRKFIEIEFGDDLYSVLISSIFDTFDSKVIGNIRQIKKILIPTNNTGTIYMRGKDDYFFEVKLKQYTNNDLENFIVDYEKKDFVKYYPLFSFVDNTTLMPLNYYVNIPQLFVESEINTMDELDVVARTKSLFNQNLDFVKTIHETSGSVIFLYGYGEKSVRINNRGRLDYKEEIGNFSSTNVIEALNVALNFIDGHGGMPDSAYLSEVKSISGPNNGYYFGFSYSIDGYPLNFNNITHPIEVEVFGTKVKTYRRLARNRISSSSNNRTDDILSPHKIIEDNITLLIDNYLTDINQKDRIISFDDNEILKNVNYIEMVYYDSLEDTKRQLIVPSWKIHIKERIYYFDCYKGKLLHSTIAN